MDDLSRTLGDGSERDLRVLSGIALYGHSSFQAGADVNFFNPKVGCAPIHVAASEALPDIFRLLFRHKGNHANPNVPTTDGLLPFHILLAQLVDLSNLQNKPMESRGLRPPTDADIEVSLCNVLECMGMVLARSDLQLEYLEHALKVTVEKNAFIKSKVTMKKLSTMTPLQIVCSFQTWNAKPITEELHKSLAKLIDKMLGRGLNPNVTAAKGALPGTVPGSTPAVFLAATRGYSKVIAVFKKVEETNFLVENKFEQTVLHVVLKAGYYNKIVVHGDESGEVNVETLKELFAGDNKRVQALMTGIVNRQDSYGNTPLHYARPYPDSGVAKLLMANGAKLDMNPQGLINVNPRTVEEYFYDHCIKTEGDDIDDEDFVIRVNFKLFEKPEEIEKVAFVPNAFDNVAIDLDETPKAWEAAQATDDDKAKLEELPSKEPNSSAEGKADTKRLEYFSDVDSLHYLLKHPVMTSFLEIELNSLRLRYVLDFAFYMIFVIVLFFFLSDNYGLSHGFNSTKMVIYTVSHPESSRKDYEITYSLVILCVILILLIGREIWQIVTLKKKYFSQYENYLEWSVIVLVILDLLPKHWFELYLPRHIAAVTLLFAFVQLYLLLVRIVPNTPVPIYINMFTTVLKTYTFILLSYMAFILSFTYAFYLIFGLDNEVPYDQTTAAPVVVVTTVSTDPNVTTTTTTTAEPWTPQPGDEFFGNIGLSFVKTLVMFVGEMDYTDLTFDHWLGYVIFVMFLFLLIIVLMNILNGLAVSDIHKIQEEVDTYYHISIVESLAYTSSVSLLAEEIIIHPNIKPENQKILGISIPGYKVSRSFQ